jgi:hypothetical protein
MEFVFSVDGNKCHLMIGDVEIWVRPEDSVIVIEPANREIYVTHQHEGHGKITLELSPEKG